MKNLIILALFASLALAKININEADRYELMTIGGLDAGRADMLIKYRTSREISDPADLQLITGFSGYDTKKLQNGFEFKKTESPQAAAPVTQPQKEVVVIERTKKVVRYRPYYRDCTDYRSDCYDRDMLVTDPGKILNYERRYRSTEGGVDRQISTSSTRKGFVQQHMSTIRTKRSHNANNCDTSSGRCEATAQSSSEVEVGF